MGRKRRASRWFGIGWGIACGVTATRALAAPLAFPSVIDEVVGARFEVAPTGSLSGAAALRVEFADLELHQVAGLRSSGARGAVRHGGLVAGVALVNVSSPVGTHARAVVEAGCTLDGWQGALRAGAERLALGGFDEVMWSVLGAVSRADVGRVSILADLDVTRRAGAHDASLLLAARLRAGAVQIAGSLRIDGDRFAGTRVSALARLHRSLAIIAGFDDATGSASAAVVIGWAAIDAAAGILQHPVLGMSRGASVAWVR